MFVKLRPTDPLRTILVKVPEEESPHIASQVMLAIVIFVSRTWSPGKNIIMVSEVKYFLASSAYSDSVAQWVEFRGQDSFEQDVVVGVTQYTFSAEQ